MKYFIISDTHFGHKNIIKYCDRPFKNVEEMDKTLIENWNKTVSNQDTVLHLGDFALCSKERARQIMSQLNGKKILIKGNHDNWSDEFYRSIGFDYVSKFPIIWHDFYILSHAPLQMGQTLGVYFNYFGHVHNNPVYQNSDNAKCVCVERTDYKPILLLED